MAVSGDAVVCLDYLYFRPGGGCSDGVSAPSERASPTITADKVSCHHISWGSVGDGQRRVVLVFRSMKRTLRARHSWLLCKYNGYFAAVDSPEFWICSRSFLCVFDNI